MIVWILGQVIFQSRYYSKAIETVNVAVVAKAAAPYTNGWLVFLQDDGIMRFQTDTGEVGDTERSSASFTTGEWQTLIIVVHYGSSVDFYRNGALLTSDGNLTSWDLDSTAFPLEFGTFDTGSSLFNGYMSMWALWDYALPTSQAILLSRDSYTIVRPASYGWTGKATAGNPWHYYLQQAV